MFGYPVFVRANVVWIHDMKGIVVASGCDGLAAIGLFVSFVVAYPGDMRRRWFVIFSGCCLLVMANILRISSLTLSQLYWPGGFNFLHEYLTEAVFDGLVLALWIFWISWGGVKKNSEENVRSSNAFG